MRANFSNQPKPEATPVNQIKQTLQNNIGKQVVVYELNRNTKKPVNKFCGIITNCSTNFFTVKVEFNKTKFDQCFNYSGFSVGLLKFEIVG